MKKVRFEADKNVNYRLRHVALTHFDTPVLILKLFTGHQMRYLWKELIKLN